MRERPRTYELMFIISPLHSSEEEVSAIIERIQQSIEAAGGEVSSINHAHPWGRRKLAYPIRAYAGGEASRRNFTEGYYVLMHFTLASAHVIEVDRTLKLTDPILRYLITSVEETRDHDRNGHADETDHDHRTEDEEELQADGAADNAPFEEEYDQGKNEQSDTDE